MARAKICYTACDWCMGGLVGQTRFWDTITLRRGSVIAKNLDPVYLKWLLEGKQDLLRLDCPHSYTQQHRYYIPLRRARLHLGEPIRSGIHDYENVAVILRPSREIRRKLLDRYWALIGARKVLVDPEPKTADYNYFDDDSASMSDTSSLSLIHF